MKTKSNEKKGIVFRELPQGYRELCLKVYLPRPIHDEAAYKKAAGVAESMAGFEEKMTDDQNDYFEAIALYMEEYDGKKVSRLSGLEVLKHLVEANGLTNADVAKVIGGDASLVSKILNGHRKITADHARALGKRFKLDAGVFIGT